MYLHLSPVMISVVCIRTSFSPTISFQLLCHTNRFSPTIMCALVSLTCRFHLLVDFTHWQISSICTCLVLSLALSLFAVTSFWLTLSFYLLYHRNQFSCMMLCALVSPTWRFHLRVDFTYSVRLSSTSRFHPLASFTYLQISPTCRLHLLLDFTYLHLTCDMTVMISAVCVRCQVILTHWFLSPAVPQKPIFTRDALRSGFTHLQISPTCRFDPLADFTYL